MSGAPKPEDLFSDATSNAERAERFESYKSALSDNIKAAHSGGQRYVHGEGFGKVDRSNIDRVEKLRELSKSLSGDQAAEVQATLNSMQADLLKEIDSGGAGSAGTPTLGGATTLGQTQGFVPVDLEAPSKKLVPRETVTRNMLPRNNSGKGTGLSYRRVRGWSNSNSSAGVGDMTSFFSSEQETTSYSGVSPIRRPNQISYATDVNTVAYMEQGLGSSVSWRSQYAGAGYEDIRQLASTALLYSTMVAENKNLLFARGSATGYAGALNGGAGPVATTLATSAVAGGGSLTTGTYYLFASYSSGAGDTIAVSQVTAGQAVTGPAGIKVSFTSSTFAIPAGVLGVNLYLAASNSIAAAFYVGTLVPNSSAGNSITITAQPTSGAQPGAAAGLTGVAADNSSSAFAYDGLLTQLTNVAGAGNGNGTGYFAQFAGSQFNSAANGIQAIGDAPFQQAFAALYGASTMPNGSNLYGTNAGAGQNPANAVYGQEQGVAFGAKLMADPDTILLDGTIRAALGTFLKQNASTSAYRIMLTQGGVNGEKVGAVVNGIYNQVTGKPVDLVVEPYMPPGASVLYSKSLPVPDSEISNTFEVRNVQDYMMYEWASIGMTWDASTYMFGSLLGFANAWSGAITGLLA